MLMAAGYRPVAIKHDAGRSYGKSLEAWQVDGDPKPFISQLVQCVDQEERAVAEIVGRLRENPFSENAIDGMVSKTVRHEGVPSDWNASGL